MNKLLFLLLIVSFTIANAATHLPNNQLTNQVDQKQMMMQSMNLQSLAFTENQGQWDESVLFRANAGGATMWFTKDGVYYQFTRRVDKIGSPPFMVGAENMDTPVTGDRGYDNEDDQFESIMIKASFVGANLEPNMVGLQEMEYKCNYFIGNDPNEWHTDVPNYEYVLYKDIYPGIDLKYYGNGKQMEYDLIVAPGVDPNQIKIKYEGAKSLSVNKAGELEVETEWNIVTEQTPYIYQETDDEQQQVVGKYHLLENNTFGFEMTEGYDNSQPLIIDPTVVYSTYLGGETTDRGNDIAVDGSGSAYVTGMTYSSTFPTVNPYQATYQDDQDVFVTKLSSSGNSLIYSTYLGSVSGEVGYGIAVDGSGNAYVTGYTSSSDFPTQNPYQATNQGSADAFVTKLSSSGNSLIYSTYLGGGDVDDGRGIAIDGSGYAYVTGYTRSTDFPTENPYQTDQVGDDVFVTKLSISGSSLIYSTYLGGDGDDYGYGIAVGGDNAYVTGYTESTDFPTENPYQLDQGFIDVFVTKLSSSGNSLIYSTYLSGGEYGRDYGYGIAVDGSGNAYVTGYTWSNDFPTVNPYQTWQGGNGYTDVFVSKFSSTGSSLIYSTYLGGGYNDRATSIAVDGSSNVYVTGWTGSTDFPTVNPYQPDHGGGERDAFVAKLSSSGNSLVYSTYLGGGDEKDGYSFTDDDEGFGIAVDDSGNVYVTGYTESPIFPTKNPYQLHQGLIDAFVVKFFDDPPYICGDADGSGTVDISDAVHLIAYIFGGGPAPDPLKAGDADCNGAVDISDPVYLIAYIFGGGPAPCEGCP